MPAKQTNQTPVDPWVQGPHVAGHTTIAIDDRTRLRTLVVEVWYPTIEQSAPGEAILEFEENSQSRETLTGLLEKSPMNCTTRITQSVRDGRANVELGPRPLIVFSHCQNCGRYSTFSIAERLASHGMVVVSVDHAGEMPYDPDASGETLSMEQLSERGRDIRTTIDSALDGVLFGQSEVLKSVSVDPSRIGILGHSFGAVTAGKVVQNDPRVRAVAGLAAPIDNVLFPGVSIDEINVPLLLVLAEEDNSILELGNDFIRANYVDANPPVWRIDVADAGHWSFSDLCGLTMSFLPGCGSGQRHSAGRTGETFDYRPVAEIIQLTQQYTTAFFLAYLDGRMDAFNRLSGESDEGVTVHVRLD